MGGTLRMTRNELFWRIENRAFGNVQKWGPQSLETLGLAIAEETGEVAQALLKFAKEGGPPGRIREEAIDLAALCIQIIDVEEAMFPGQKMEG